MWVVVAAGLLSSFVSSAGAETPSDAVQDLGARHLRPGPVFATRFPAPVADSDARVSTHGKYFDVEFTKTDSQGYFSQIVEFTRSSYPSLAQMIHFTRDLQRNPVRQERVGHRSVWYGQGDISFYYAWHEQGFTYMVSSKYYGGVHKGHLAALVANAHRLRSRRVHAAYYQDPADSFTGQGCGSTASVAWDLPQGAFDASLGEPAIGTVFHDTFTGAPVARITSSQLVRDGSRLRAEWTATGSDDVCANPESYPDGWQTYEDRFYVDFTLSETNYY